MEGICFERSSCNHRKEMVRAPHTRIDFDGEALSAVGEERDEILQIERH